MFKAQCNIYATCIFLNAVYGKAYVRQGSCNLGFV